MLAFHFRVEIVTALSNSALFECGVDERTGWTADHSPAQPEASNRVMMNFLKSMLSGSNDDVGPDKAAALIDAGAPVVDVREPGEFETGAIPGAINVPLSQIQAHGLDALRRAKIDVDAPVIVLACRSGARSGSACMVLREALGIRARNLSGGVLAWSSHGLRLTPGGRSSP